MRSFALGLHGQSKIEKGSARGDRAQRLEAFCPAMRRKGRLCLGAVRLASLALAIATIALCGSEL